jgi:hypothetical protein
MFIAFGILMCRINVAPVSQVCHFGAVYDKELKIAAVG